VDTVKHVKKKTHFILSQGTLISRFRCTGWVGVMLMLITNAILYFSKDWGEQWESSFPNSPRFMVNGSVR
jgi:hypothetical protein